MQKWGRFEVDTVNQITDHLLGKNWYACDTGDCYNVNPIVIETIKSEFPCAGNLYCEHRFLKRCYGQFGPQYEEIRRYSMFRFGKALYRTKKYREESCRKFNENTKIVVSF